MLGRNCRFLQGQEQDQLGVAEIHRALVEQREGHAVLRNYRRDGSTFWMDLTVSPVRDETGRVTHFVGIQNDLTDFKRYEAEIEHRGSHDNLTNLPNRKLLEDRVDQASALARRTPHSFGLLFIDLDRFKMYNDAFGHAQGDRILRIIAGRLIGAVREGDTVARLGANEFAPMCPDLDSPDEIHGIVAQVMTAIGSPIEREGESYRLTASIGVAIAPRDGADTGALFKSAGLAMQRAKEQCRDNFQFFTPELQARAVARMRVESTLKQAIAAGELRLLYQPQVSLDTGQVVGFEALIRWHHPVRGIVLPGEFIKIAEESGLIVSDQRMPGMSGTEFLRRVKSLHPDTVRIVLSGYTDLATVTAAINEGAIYRFLTKPWDDESLREDIRQAFQLHEARTVPARTAPAAGARRGARYQAAIHKS